MNLNRKFRIGDKVVNHGNSDDEMMYTQQSTLHAPAGALRYSHLGREHGSNGSPIFIFGF